MLHSCRALVQQMRAACASTRQARRLRSGPACSCPAAACCSRRAPHAVAQLEDLVAEHVVVKLLACRLTLGVHPLLWWPGGHTGPVSLTPSTALGITGCIAAAYHLVLLHLGGFIAPLHTTPAPHLHLQPHPISTDTNTSMRMSSSPDPIPIPIPPSPPACAGRRQRCGPGVCVTWPR
jgi:hypothetical protein